jgi:hypothetical protein
MDIFDISTRDNILVLSKKELESKARNLMIEELENGTTNNYELLSKLTKINDFTSCMLSVLKPQIQNELNGEKHESHNIKISHGNTGDRLSYEDDIVYKDILKALKEREELLKLAYKSSETIFDSKGVEVPKVSVKTPSSSYIKVNY